MVDMASGTNGPHVTRLVGLGPGQEPGTATPPLLCMVASLVSSSSVLVVGDKRKPAISDRAQLLDPGGCGTSGAPALCPVVGAKLRGRGGVTTLPLPMEGHSAQDHS